jgi:hypothetical protein
MSECALTVSVCCTVFKIFLKKGKTELGLVKLGQTQQSTPTSTKKREANNLSATTTPHPPPIPREQVYIRGDVFFYQVYIFCFVQWSICNIQFFFKLKQYERLLLLHYIKRNRVLKSILNNIFLI